MRFNERNRKRKGNGERTEPRRPLFGFLRERKEAVLKARIVSGESTKRWAIGSVLGSKVSTWMTNLSLYSLI